jgi:hypothetical protein
LDAPFCVQRSRKTAAALAFALVLALALAFALAFLSVIPGGNLLLLLPLFFPSPTTQVILASVQARPNLQNISWKNRIGTPTVTNPPATLRNPAHTVTNPPINAKNPTHNVKRPKPSCPKSHVQTGPILISFLASEFSLVREGTNTPNSTQTQTAASKELPTNPLDKIANIEPRQNCST